MDGMTQALASDAPRRAISKNPIAGTGTSTTRRGPRLSDDRMAIAAIELDVTELLESAETQMGEPDVRVDPARLLGITRLVSINRAALELLGWPESAARGLTPVAIFPDADRDAFIDVIASAGATDGVVRREGRMRRIDGDPCPVIFTARVSQRVGSKVRVAVQCTDLRGLAPAKDAGADTAALQRTLFRNLPLGLCRVNGDRLSPFYAELGVGPDTDLGAFFEANPGLLDRAADLCIIEDVNPEAVRILGAGSADELVGRSVAFAWRSRPDVFIQTLVAGVQARKHECETELNMLDGGRRDVIPASATVREDGRRASIIAMVDIGDRVAAKTDLIRLQAQFVQPYRLSLLTELSSWFAHEISQPLVAIAAMATTGARWLDKDAPQIDEARHAFDRILSSAVRSRGIIDRLRSMAMNHAPVLAPQRMSNVVTAAMRLVEGDAKTAGVTIATRLTGCDDCVSMDRAQIGQVVVNLLMNAIEAVDRSACVVREVAIDIVVDDDCVECSVSDSGAGIAATAVANAFAELVPGAAGRAGFGLTISRSIVALHQGRLTLDGTSPLGGAKISFRLPRAQAPCRLPTELDPFSDR